MNIIILLFLTLSCRSVLMISNKWDCADYYWRDYFGKIPYDAVPLANNYTDDSRFIGLVYIRNYEFLPATIYGKEGYAQTAAYTFVLNATEHVLILCSPFKRALEWIRVESKDLHSLIESRNLIPGGSEIKESLYIGRIFRNNRPYVGKIFKHYMANRGIWYTDGAHIYNSLVYEILAYNCKKAYLPCFGAGAKEIDDN